MCPRSDRKIDARTFLPTFGAQAGASRRKRLPVPGAFSTVPRNQKTGRGRPGSPEPDAFSQPGPPAAARIRRPVVRTVEIRRRRDALVRLLMAEQCTAAFDAVAGPLGGFSCHHAPTFIHLRNPFALTNWTAPVLELMMVTGAVMALIHADPPPSPRRRSDQPRPLVRHGRLLVGHRDPAVFPERLRHPRPARSRVRAQRLHRAVLVRPATALHRRSVPGRRQSRLRNCPRFRRIS